jgi:3-isopropylmalate dehydrogenase
VHGSAPGIAGKDIADPIGAIGSVAMLLRHGLGLTVAADAVTLAIRTAIAEGARTADIAAPGAPVLGTRAMGELVAALVRLPEGRPSSTGSRK